MPEDGLDFTGHVLRQHPGAERRHAGATSRSSSSASRWATRRRTSGAAWTVLDWARPTHPRRGRRRRPTREPTSDFRWLMSSDVCKHCTDAACLDVCPTGALFRTEFGTVVVQEDICNGCGYCVPACPYGVIGKREEDGRVWKCTLCYDRLARARSRPARRRARRTRSSSASSRSCASAASGRVEQLHEAGVHRGAPVRPRPRRRRRR